MAHDWPSTLTRLLSGSDLEPARAGWVMSEILAGNATDAQIAGVLVALRAKGESAGEIAALLDAAMDAARSVPLSDAEQAAAVDIVGTGGDGSHSINVSTMAAIVAAGAGASVCKHGNRSASSKCGAADVLELLGVTLEQTGEVVAACVREAGIGFCFAPVFHPAFRFAGPPRRQLGVPTVFNLLGPMANPGRVRRQVIGVADPSRAATMVEALRLRGLTHAWVVHGDGLDELTTTGPSTVLALDDGEVREFVVDPVELGLTPATAADLAGGSPEDNADAVRRVLAGEPGAHRDVVLLNAAAALVVAGVADDLAAALERAAASIDDGAAAAALDGLVARSASHAA